jgi:hypothetical protein
MYKKSAYKYACFACRKAFSREPEWFLQKYDDENAKNRKRITAIHLPELTATCPECGGVMYFMGKRFKPPPKNKVKAWAYWETVGRRMYAEWLVKSRGLAEKIDPYFSQRKK